MDIKRKIITGTFWVGFARVINRSSLFIVALILTRYIPPKEYGLVTVGLLIITLLRVLTELGLQKSLIKQRDISQAHFDTGWTFEIFKGILISAAIYIFAPLFANIFREPDAVSFIRVMGLSPLILSLTHFKLFLFDKNLDFSKVFALETVTLILGIPVTIGAAIILRNAWALVIGYLFSGMIRLAVSYFYFPTFPKLRFHRGSFNEMFSFGKWIFLGGIVSYLVMEGDKYVVANVFGIAALGLYKMAHNISHIVVDELKRTLGRVLFPSYVMLQDTPDLIKVTVLQNYSLIFSIIGPITIGIALVAHDFGNFVIASEWSKIANILCILGIAGFTRGIVVGIMGVFWGIGKPNVPVYLETVRLTLIGSSIWWLLNSFGIIGIGYSLILANIGASAFMVYFLDKHFQISVKELWQTNYPGILSLMIMVIVVQLLKTIISPSILRFTLSIGLGSAIYLGIHFILFKLNHKGPLVAFRTVRP